MEAIKQSSRALLFPFMFSLYHKNEITVLLLLLLLLLLFNFVLRSWQELRPMSLRKPVKKKQFLWDFSTS